MTTARPKIYATMDDVHAEIVQAIENDSSALAAEYNLDAIAADCYTYDPAAGRIQDAGWKATADVEDFWASVERHTITEFGVEFVRGTTDDQEAWGNTVGWLQVTGWEGGEVETIQYTTATPEEWTPEDYTAALTAAEWEVITLTRDGGTVRRKA